MLASCPSLTRRFAAPMISKAEVELIGGIEWFCRNKDGKGVVLSTGAGSAPTPPDALLMAYGACAASGLKFLLEKRGKKVRKLVTDVEGRWAMDPQRRLDDISLHFKVDVDGVTQDELDKLVAQIEAKMCPVGQTLRAGTVVKRVD